MRIAFLCKRRYMGKDVILDRYARLYEIPLQLAKLGHDVVGFCLDYHASGAGEWTHDAAPGLLQWRSCSLDALLIPTLASYPHRLLRRLRTFAPDILVGASDIPHVVLTAWLARKLQIPYAVDLYDNFEGFGQARIPGFVPSLRRATRGADLIMTTSEPLRQFVMETYRARGSVVAMPSSVDKSVFKPLDRQHARYRLGLPDKARLIGTAGGLYRDKGIAPLYEAWAAIEIARPDVHLVIAGPQDAGLPPPSGERVHYLGHLAHASVAELFNALDVGVISVLDTPFGRYCFPQKAYEMLACGLNVVAADIGALSSLFADTPQLLFRANDASALADAVIRQLEHPVSPNLPILDWAQLIQGIEPLLSRLVNPAAP
ncbi:glycosyltransferase family 4 protein [Solimonas soli]|uniref:glycosyltransferase family 4 protein n=1 Tax=Solimonas soli TaxID=413479 RepID=UPI00048351F5|nr:glycosyltransferase family 4 protein [Solimonas soli]